MSEQENSSNPKLRIMWESLSKERQAEINKMLIETIKKFEDSGQVEIGKIYPFELTNAFDQEEPIQYVYLMCAFRLLKPEKPMIVNINLPPTSSIMDIAFQDCEVFKKENMGDWLDHVNRIEKNNSENKENQLFYEDNIFEKNKKVDKNETESNIEGDKKEVNEKQIKRNPNQCNINKPIEEKDLKVKSGIMIGQSGIINNDNDEKEEEYNESNIRHEIPKKDFFDFYNENEPEKTNEQYISIFRTYARNVVNCTMLMYYSHRLDEDNNDVVMPLYNLKDLQSAFSTCDFWKFNKSELGQLGFMNWSDDFLLIPVWAFPIILKNSKNKKVYTPASQELMIRDINVHEKPLIKYGCVPYGFKIEELK